MEKKKRKANERLEDIQFKGPKKGGKASNSHVKKLFHLQPF